MGKKGIKTDVLTIVPRTEWEAEPPKSTEPLELPVQQVLFTYTKTKVCKEREHCLSIVFDIQSEHMEKNMPDIAYNFLVGSDGAVYEGRGWHVQPTMTDDKCLSPEFEGKSILIAYIGSFHDDDFPDKPILKIKDLLVRFGISKNYIKNEFHVPWQWEPVLIFDEEKYPEFVTAKLLRKDCEEKMGEAVLASKKKIPEEMRNLQ